MSLAFSPEELISTYPYLGLLLYLVFLVSLVLIHASPHFPLNPSSSATFRSSSSSQKPLTPRQVSLHKLLLWRMSYWPYFSLSTIVLGAVYLGVTFLFIFALPPYTRRDTFKKAGLSCVGSMLIALVLTARHPIMGMWRRFDASHLFVFHRVFGLGAVVLAVCHVTVFFWVESWAMVLDILTHLNTKLAVGLGSFVAILAMGFVALPLVAVPYYTAFYWIHIIG